MPTSAVYQPTTVTYEQQPTDQRWNCPIYNFSRRMRSNWNRMLGMGVALFFTGFITIIVGFVLLVLGSIKICKAVPPLPPTLENGIGELVASSILMCLGLIIAGVGLCYRSEWVNGKESPASGAAALTALNPSTDPLVAAQYAPVRDAPPAPDDEMRNLMDNKDCLSSAEESDKMLDGRPSSVA